MSELKTQFDEAVNLVRTAKGDFQPSNDMKLEFYALFKQATEGNVTGKRPGLLSIIERAKYDAWAKLQGMSRESAMQQYVTKVNTLKAKLS